MKRYEENRQRELYELERKICDLINEGFISDFPQLLAYMRKLYQDKYYPKVFLTSN